MNLTRENEKDVILIIDDNVTNIRVIADHLKEHGFEIIIARDGETGLERAGFSQPDIILLDVMMPGMDGFETCRRLKSDASTRDIPVLFMTVLTETSDKIKGFEAGGVDYVTKPIQKEEVLARVTTHLKMQRMRKRLEKKNEILHFQAMLLDKIRDLIVATDLNGRITYVNHVVTEVFEKPKRELIGQMVHVLGDVPEKGATQDEIIEKTKSNGKWQGNVVN